MRIFAHMLQNLPQVKLDFLTDFSKTGFFAERVGIFADTYSSIQLLVRSRLALFIASNFGKCHVEAASHILVTSESEAEKTQFHPNGNWGRIDECNGSHSRRCCRKISEKHSSILPQIHSNKSPHFFQNYAQK